MARERLFRVLVATDGSSHARGAITTALHFPWPDDAWVRVVMARDPGSWSGRPTRLAAVEGAVDNAAERARRALVSRWPNVEVVIVDEAPVKGILAEATRF